MKLYRISKWNELYENSRSRTVKELSWVPIQNALDGETFTTIMGHKDGATIFAGFILMVEVASRCEPRGTLVRGNGKPHNVTSLSAKCRCPISWFSIALDYLEKNTDWLEYETVPDDRHLGDTTPTLYYQAGDEEWKEGNGRKEQKAVPADGSKITSPKRQLTDGWIKSFPIYNNRDYHFQDAKDGKAADRLLTYGLSPDQILKIAVEAWKRPTEFNCKQAASISGFASRFNEIQSELSQLSLAATPKRRGPNIEDCNPDGSPRV